MQRSAPRAISSPLESRLSWTPTVFVLGAGSGIRTHEGVMPNGCRVIGPIMPYWDLKAVALTTQPSRRKRDQESTSLKPFPAKPASEDRWLGHHYSRGAVFLHYCLREGRVVTHRPPL